jgi:heat-inducible transcriptional repressor
VNDVLNERKLKILRAVVDDYITTGIPVGSRTISRKYLDWSSATIRNEMMDLEELGYLAQPHTSAGRIPSERAYRLYVERLMNVSELNADEIEALQGHVRNRSRDLKQLLRDAAKAISDATTYTAFVLPPNPRGIRINNIQLVPVTTGLALLVLVTDAGIFKDTFVRVSPEFGQEDLAKISAMLQSCLVGNTISEVTAQLEGQMRQSVQGQREVLDAVLSGINEQLCAEQGSDIVLGGPANILKHPEYANIEKARMFLSAMESRETLLPLLERSRGMKFTVTIGNENAHEAMRDCSVVTVSYSVDGAPSGSIGVIGPTRMNYSHVASVLKYMQGIMSQMMDERAENHRSALPEPEKR